MNTPPPEITDPLLKSLIDEAADLPHMAALEARRNRKPAREEAAHRSFDVWGGLVWLMRFRAAQAAVALLILAAMVEGGSLLTGERSPLASKRGADLLSAATVTTKSGEHADATNAYWSGAAGSGGSGTWNTFASGTNANTNWLSAQTGGSDTLQIDAGSSFDVWNTSNGTIGALTGSGTVNRPGYANGQDGVYSGKWAFNGPAPNTTNVLLKEVPAGSPPGADSGGGANNATWSTGANWGDTSWNSLGSSGQTVPLLPGAGGLSGTLSAGDTAIFADFSDDAGTEVVAGNNSYSGPPINGDMRLKSQTSSSPNLYAPRRVDKINQAESKTGGPKGNKTYGVTVTDGSASPGSSTVSGTLDVSGNRVAIGSLASKGGGDWDNGSDLPGDKKTLEQDRLYSTVDDMFYTGTAQAKAPSTGKGKYVLAQNLPLQTQVHRPPAPATAAAPATTPAPVIDTRKLIRNAALDFEVASFEKALDTITAVAGEEQGYVFSQSSAKGANGKLQGQVIVKVLPANVDRFLLKLRLLGDMKNQTVSAQDVSKDYYDTEARIRNSEVTEARLIDMMKTRTGKVSDLLEVENEIAKVRGEIEQMQGQLKFYDALVQYATVTISLEEKDLNQAAAYLLTEQAQLYLFSKDVEKAFTDAKADAADAKAQTLESHIERDEAGHVIATLHLLIPPDVADATIVKLKEIGRIQHFNSQTQRVAKDDGNDAAPSDTAKVDRDKVELTMTIQQDAENPVQGTNISVQTDQVDEKTQQIKDEAADAGVEVKGAQFNRLRNGVEISALLLRMPIKNYSAFLERIKALGKVKEFTVARREDATVTDDAPAEIVLHIFSQAGIVAPDTGLWFTVRHTLGEGMGALMWSLRMIGVSVAFIAPWAGVLAIVAWVAVRRRKARKQG